MATESKTSLTRKAQQALLQLIDVDALEPGEKLPTEKVLAEQFGVSRTVIREAIAGLRADGILEVRHGVGVFLSIEKEEQYQDIAKSPSLPFTAPLIDMLELRMSIEIYAASLAAERRSWAQEARIFQSAEEFARALRAGESSDLADWAFHRSISEASNNEAFVEFFDRVGMAILPRRKLQKAQPNNLIMNKYLATSIHEHLEICEAIASGSAVAAAAAMRAHIGGSQARYRRLLQTGNAPWSEDQA
ncbi:FCD domain-containing protein [Pseudomonas sp. GX19020]|uniref:FadR/GntR family transcriptional regulator n=1 Tax=Pseudomonas sp. GX19020 TaxID=2942277 RepID=UPI002018C4BC|nr:FCD domain-containing protein [Pseudomonas sp. GX19020]MCL4068086.1 FCD domain-containing protein [Pseudomonas sp. GX19020]